MSLVPSAVIATTEGVVLIPSAFSMTLGAAPSIIATQELVVPRSIPIMDSPDLFIQKKRMRSFGKEVSDKLLQQKHKQANVKSYENDLATVWKRDFLVEKSFESIFAM